MELFKKIIKNIENDAELSTDKEYVTIVEKTDDYITIFDAMDGEIEARYYTIYNPDKINEKYINSIVLFSDNSLNNKSIYTINKKTIINYLDKKVDKNMLMTVKKIVFITGEEDENDSIYLDKEIQDGLEAGHCFPDDLLGLTWWDKDVILINIKEIQQTSIVTLKDMNINNVNEYKSETSIGILTTMLHEIRHCAQENYYLPEKILNLLSDDLEVDAEEYARNWFETNPAYVLAV